MRIVDTAELFALPKPSWLIEDFVAEKSTTMIYGPWGLGKSFLALDMALTATKGEAWFGNREITRPVKTLFIVAEGAAWWPPRIEAYSDYRGGFDEDNILWVPEPVDLWQGGPQNANFDKGYNELFDAIEKHQPDMLIVDTWVRCTGAFGMNEDKAVDTAAVYRKLEAIREKFGTAPVIIHHPTKAGGSQRGSGNQEASLEVVAELKEVDGRNDAFMVSSRKGNHMEPYLDFRMELVSVDTTLGGSAYLRYAGEDAGKVDLPGTIWDVIVRFNPKGSFTSTAVKKAWLAADESHKPGSFSSGLRALVDKGLLEKVAHGAYAVKKSGIEEPV